MSPGNRDVPSKSFSSPLLLGRLMTCFFLGVGTEQKELCNEHRNQQEQYERALLEKETEREIAVEVSFYLPHILLVSLSFLSNLSQLALISLNVLSMFSQCSLNVLSFLSIFHTSLSLIALISSQEQAAAAMALGKAEVKLSEQLQAKESALIELKEAKQTLETEMQQHAKTKQVHNRGCDFRRNSPLVFL